MGSAPFAFTSGNSLSLGGNTSDYYATAASDATKLPLAGGTLSGALTGTAATFSGAVAAQSFSGNGAALTALNATSIASGTLADAQLGANIPRLGATVTQTFAAGLAAPTFAGDGSGLTNLSDAGLSANVARLNAGNAFTGANTFAGKVGIGTTTPGAMLDVNGWFRVISGYAGLAGAQISNQGSFGQIEIYNTKANNDVSFLSFHSGGNVAWQQGILGSTYVVSATGGPAKTNNDHPLFSITPSGNVGIGTVTPAATLDVNGDAATRGTQWIGTAPLASGDWRTGLKNTLGATVMRG